MIVASYKENPKVKLQAGESADWWAYHTGPVVYNRNQRQQPRRWHAKVLACTEPTATARQVIEWYEVRWQIEMSHSDYPSSSWLYFKQHAA